MGCLDVFLDVLNDTGKNKRFPTQTALATHCGVLPGQVNKWIRGKGLDNISKTFAIVDKLGCTLLAPNQGLDGFDLVPKVVARCGAGGSLEVSSDVTDRYAFRSSFFGINNISPRNAVIMEVTGDSMEPTIFDGDTVLIDQSDTTPRDGYIYVVTLGDELKVKRMQKSISGISLISDNTKYAPISVSINEIEQLIIQGRVRWIGRNI